ncbi:MBL fold metallo-hydrolase [bacterium]|nr:MBL fold metallo-hydrolase [bacterium]
MNGLILKTLASLAFLAPAVLTAAAKDSPRSIRLTVVFNNEVADSSLASLWGFGCLIQGYERTILFDTGANGDTLLDNMRRLGLDPRAVQTVVLSHEHHDHTDGLAAFLAANPKVKVILPGAFPDTIKSVAAAAESVEEVHGPAEICKGVRTTGELGDKIIEQALLLSTPRGLIVLTGCAHPGIVNIAAAARKQTGEPLYLVGGGFHLENYSREQIAAAIDSLKALGVQKVAPTHCTGDTGRELFRAAWGEDFVRLDLGSRLIVE